MKLHVFFTMLALSSAVMTSAFAKTDIVPGLTVYGLADGNHLVGEVIRTFENERSEVRWSRLNGDYYSGLTNIWKDDALWPRATCSSDNRICEGAIVYGRNGNHIVGTVKRVFENDRVEVSWNQLNGMHYAGHLSYWPAHALALENSRGGGQGQYDGPYQEQEQYQEQRQAPAPLPAPAPQQQQQQQQAPAPLPAPEPRQEQEQYQNQYQYQDQRTQYQGRRRSSRQPGEATSAGGDLDSLRAQQSSRTYVDCPDGNCRTR